MSFQFIKNRLCSNVIKIPRRVFGCAARKLFYHHQFLAHYTISIHINTALVHTRRLRYKLTKQLKENSLISITWETEGHAKSHESFIAEMMRDGFLEKFEYV